MNAQDGVLDLVRRWAAAEERNDAATLDGLLADGFAGVGPFGFILTRDQWLARFTNGLVNRSFEVTDLQVRDLGTAAVGTGGLAARACAHRPAAGAAGTSVVSGAFAPKVVAAGEGKTVMLFGVRFGYKVVSGDSGGRLAVLEVEIPP